MHQDDIEALVFYVLNQKQSLSLPGIELIYHTKDPVSALQDTKMSPFHAALSLRITGKRTSWFTQNTETFYLGKYYVFDLYSQVAKAQQAFLSLSSHDQNEILTWYSTGIEKHKELVNSYLVEAFEKQYPGKFNRPDEPVPPPGHKKRLTA